MLLHGFYSIRLPGAILLATGMAAAQTYYWNPSAPLLNAGVGEAQKSYNWSSEKTGGGSRPNSAFDDDFSANALGSKWSIADKDGFTDSPRNPYISLTDIPGQLTMRARGEDVWHENNKFAAAYRTDITGDFDVSVKVVSQFFADSWSKAGIVMRNGFTGSDSAGYAMVVVAPASNTGFTFQYDLAAPAGELDGSVNVGPPVYPCWLRLAKKGSSVSAYYKTALANPWTQLGTAQTPLGMAVNSQIGLAVSSHDPNETSTAVFDDFHGGGDIQPAALDLRFGEGTSAAADSGARLGAPLSVRSVAFAANKVAFDFQSYALSLTANADFSGAKSVAAGTGTLAFGAGRQTLIPRAGMAFPALSKTGADTLTISASAFSAGKLTLSAGVLNCGPGSKEFAGIAATGGALIGPGAADTLAFTADADFSGLAALPAAGTVLLRAASADLAFTPGLPGFPNLILWPRPVAADASIKTMAGTLSVKGNLVLRAEKASAGGFAGSVDFRPGNTNVTLGGNLARGEAGAPAGVNSLRAYLGKGTWTIGGDADLNLPATAAMSADSATFEFIAAFPALQNLSAGTAVLGTLRHTGSGVLNLLQPGAAPVAAVSFTQTAGALNFNGSDLSVSGSIIVANGAPGSLTGLGGRSLKAGGNISLSGSSVSQLGLNPANPWTVAGGGSLSADWADIGKSNADASADSGAASANCANLGGNSKWSFGAAKPNFILQPALTLEVLAGQPAVFRAKAAGSQPIAYEWRKVGETAVLSNEDSLKFAKADPAQNGAVYFCTAINQAGSVESVHGSLIVNEPPKIDVQPVDSTVVAGSSVSFKVIARGTAPLRYAWRKNADTTVIGKAATLSFDSTLASQDGDKYTCTITNNYGNAVSRAALLTLRIPPRIVRQPASLTVAAGQKAVFSIGAAGTPTLAFAWTRGTDTTVLSRDSLLTLDTVLLADSNAAFRCRVSNDYGAVTSSVGQLTVVQAATIVREPANVTVAPGRAAIITVGVVGAKPLAYAWRLKGDTTVIARDTLLKLDSVKPADNGKIFVFTVSNAYGADTSREAKLTVATCDSLFAAAPDTLIVDEGQVGLAKGTARCASARQWSVIEGPGPRLLDPETDTLAFSVPRVAADTQFTLRFSAQYGDAWVNKNMVVKIREAIPDPRFSLPPPGKWKGPKPYVVKASLLNEAALKAARYVPDLRYQWYLSAPAADTAIGGDSLVLTSPNQGGNLDITLCMDNGGASICAIHAVDIDMASVGLMRRAARFGAVSLQGGSLAWNTDASVRVWDFRGRVLWQGRGRAGQVIALPESAALDLLRGRARLEIRRP